MKNSRTKGAVAEREVAKMFEEWWGKVEPGCKFKKTPLSGGWSSPDVRREFQTSGDLVTTAKKFPFSVEVKRREKWSWASLYKGGRSPVWGWWLQAETQGAEMLKTPLLLVRHNREEWHVIFPVDSLDISKSANVWIRTLRIPKNVHATYRGLGMVKWSEFVCLQDFLEIKHEDACASGAE
jgi:Holliday junction resolvase